MSKPEDISQEAWDAAKEAMGRVGLHMTGVRVACARAIMAAKASALIEIAEMMDVFADTADFSAMNARDDEEVAHYRIEEAAHRGAAAAIRGTP